MRRLSFFALLLGVGALGFGATQAALVLTAPVSTAEIADIETAAPIAPPVTASQQDDRVWPALFGEIVVEEPQPPTPPEPQPPTQTAPPNPPVESLGYTLKGVFTNEAGKYAFVSHPTGDVLLRVGDEIIEGVAVLDIDDTGITLSTSRGEERLVFAEER